MKTPIINGIELNTVDDVFEALAAHAGGDFESTGVFDDLNPAIVGLSHDNRVIYDYNKIIQLYMKRDGMTEEEATEFVEYNTMRTLPYMGKQPVILYPLDGYKEVPDEKE